MKFTRQALLLIITLCLASGRAQAHNALFAITPGENMAGGFTFKLTPAPLPGGGAKFCVVITENQTWFSAHPLAELGILKSTQSAKSIIPGRKVSCTREGKALVCVFTVSSAELANPDFCLFFCNLEHALDDKVLFLLSKDFIFARLKPFAPRRP